MTRSILNLTMQQKRDIVAAREITHRSYMVERTAEGPLVHCNYGCDWDEAEGGLLGQCRRCLSIQEELRSAP